MSDAAFRIQSAQQLYLQQLIFIQYYRLFLFSRLLLLRRLALEKSEISAGSAPEYKDPTGHLTMILPGTQASATTWKVADTGATYDMKNETFRQAVSKTFGEEAEIRSKKDGSELANKSEDRDKFAREIADYINKHDFKKGEKLNIVAHSHGGNAVKRLTELVASGEIKLKQPIDNVVNLGTPQRDDYNFRTKDTKGNTIVKNIYNVTSDNDGIQRKGGCDRYLPYCAAGQYERTAGAREIKANTAVYTTTKPDMSAEYTTFTTERETKEVSHGLLHSAPVWEQHVAPVIGK